MISERVDTPSGDDGEPAQSPSGQAAAAFASLSAFQEFATAAEGRLAARWALECALPAALDGDALHGECCVCKAPREFELPSQRLGQAANLREELVCNVCRLNARVRAALGLLDSTIADLPNPAVYLTEQASFAYARLQSRFPSLIGTEYFADPAAGEALGKYLTALMGRPCDARFGDVTDLPFDTAAFDAVLSFDVLEHVPDFTAALGEFARVLRPDGTLILTAPFLPGEELTRVLARHGEDGTIEHLCPPEYHGDPLSEQGVLCYYHFGWDLLSHARSAGFSEACFVLPWSLREAVLGGCWTLVARR